MSICESNIGATFWIVADQSEANDWADSLQQRLESDGTGVETISIGNVMDDLELSAVDPEARIRVICHLVVRLQKHGIVPIVVWSDPDTELLELAEGELEQQAFFVDHNHPISYTGARMIEDDESFVDVVMEVADRRGLFDEALSDQRSEEEVTDRLKNLGYI